MKKHLTTIALVLILVVGLAIMLYPTVSDMLSSKRQAGVMTTYSHAVTAKRDYTDEWDAARSFNQSLAEKANRFRLNDEEQQAYERCLNVGGRGVIGTISIPRIDVSLPIYHGTSDSVLQAGIGHIEGTSLPTGEQGTHCALSGHRGLPSATLFTNLDRVAVGDTFQLTVLDRRQLYQVDQILVVLPEEMDALAIDPQETYCTLVTCTPYGINSHRLLVRGRLVAPDDRVLVTDVRQLDAFWVTIVTAIPLVLLALVWIACFLRYRRNSTRKER